MTGKIHSRDEIVAQFKDGRRSCAAALPTRGVPNNLIQCLLDSGAKHLTLISNDTGDADLTIGRLVHHRRVDRIVASHVGMNTETVALIEAGEIAVTFVPQGSLMERLRCGGSGLGGVLTKTGLGTIMEEGKQIIRVDGEDYILETPLRADVALVRARMADPLGNLSYRGTSRNTNPLVAKAADVTLVDADLIMEVDEIGIDRIVTPGVFVDMILAH